MNKERNGLLTALIALAALCLGLSLTRAADAIPPAPTRYFNDYANVTRPATQEQLNRQLEQFERDQSCQIVVAVFPSLPQGAAMEDFTYRTATAWRVGQSKLNNGAILFLFINDRKMRIEVGYGLEGKIPDAIAKRITSEQIKPQLQRGDYDAALTAGVNGLIAAARGEYKGTGRTVDDSHRQGSGSNIPFFVLMIIFLGVFGVIGSIMRRARGSVYGRRGYSSWGGFPTVWSSGASSWGGGGGGGGGGFSGGGGSFGGGGASDSW